MRALRMLACLGGAAGVLVLVPLVHRSPETTYGGADPRLLVLEAGAALALLMIAAAGRSTAGAIPLAAVGAGWLAPELAGAAGVPLPIRTLADALGVVLAAALLVTLVLRSGRSRAHRGPLLITALGGSLAVLARVLLVDPFDDPACWRSCRHNPLLIAADGSGSTPYLVGLLLLGAGMVWSAGRVLGGMVSRNASAPWADLAGWVALASLVGALLLSSNGVIRAPDGAATWAFALVQVAVLMWAAVLAWEAWTWWLLESRLSHFGDLLGGGSDPEALVRSLRRAVRDPGLRLAYWAPARQSYVDQSGRPADGPRPGPSERVTELTRRGQTIAAVVHARRVDGPRLERALRPAVRLALENAQLRAAALAELSELTNSRVRMVERAELERRRLERNLHDGAQQRVVSLALLVRIVAAQAAPADHAAVRRAEVLTRTLVDELRRVARGIYPAVLSDAGLVGGVVDLAERSSDLPVVVGDFPDARYAGTVETTAYLLISTAIADARSRGAASITVTAVDVDGTLRVSAEDDLATTPYPITAAFADQVRALGGTLLHDGAPGRRCIQVVLPCGS